MASASAPSVESTNETTNYARLCRLLLDVGSQALRDTFDRIHPPAGLHLVLAPGTPAHGTLQLLRKKRILNRIQWGKLYPAVPTSVSSASFDITLLMVLLRSICHLTPPVTGWDKLPSATDTSTEANIVRVKYYRNTVYSSASQASVDDTTFNSQWQDISQALVALGGASYRAAIDKLKNECMDPDAAEERYRELRKEWKRDEESIKEKLEEIRGLPVRQFTASAPAPSVASTNETTNFARLCRLLLDVGSQALRDTFDRIHPPAGLHLALAPGTPAHGTLRLLIKKQILSPIQWRKLYPAVPTSVSSANFDITLLVVLLSNVCHLTPPVTGWYTLPSAADTSTEANIARVKYYRNTVYGSASQASVDDATFNILWQDISQALEALGGASYRAAIDKLKNECMDPDAAEERYRELLKEWKRDEDSTIEKFEEMEVFNKEVLKQVKEEKGDITDKLGQVEDKLQMKSEIANVSDKLDTLLTQRETEDEENLKETPEQMGHQVKKVSEKLDSLRQSSQDEVDELVIRNAAIKLEADYKECVRVLPYLQNGKVEIHVYFYSDKSGKPTGLNNAAQTLFGQKDWKLEWKDLYNDAFNLLKVTPIRYSSGKPKRLEASQVDEIDEIINKRLHDFCKHRNVTAVQPSFKVTNSVQTQEACIAVYVLGKGEIPLGESPIPPAIGSYPVDIVNGFFVGTNDPYMPKEAHEQEEFLRLGASIGVKGKQSSGTLGAIVEDEKSGTLYALSCNHVLNDDDEKEIIHPGLDVYLNYLRYNLNNYKGEIAIVLGSTGELPQFPDDVREVSELNTMFSNIKVIKEQNGASIESGASNYTKRVLRTCEEKLEKAFVEPPRTIAKYLVGVTSNVIMTNGKEHFIDVAIAKLEEDEVRALKDEKKVRIIGTPHYPSSEHLPATAEVNDLFKSGSATGFTKTNCLADEVHNRKAYIRGGGRGNWIDVGCFPCNKGSEPAQSARCELCRPHGWFRRCLCIPDKEGQPFSREGDSGAVIFEERKEILSSSGFAIVFGKLDTTHHAFAVASPLQFALEELSRIVEDLNSETFRLKLASEF